jgi:hypothetical protein
MNGDYKFRMIIYAKGANVLFPVCLQILLVLFCVEIWEGLLNQLLVSGGAYIGHFLLIVFIKAKTTILLLRQ